VALYSRGGHSRRVGEGSPGTDDAQGTTSADLGRRRATKRRRSELSGGAPAAASEGRLASRSSGSRLERRTACQPELGISIGTKDGLPSRSSGSRLERRPEGSRRRRPRAPAFASTETGAKLRRARRSEVGNVKGPHRAKWRSACGRKRGPEGSRRRRPRARSEVGNVKGPHRAKLINGGAGICNLVAAV
jgi:hypothetical protein